MDEKFEYALRYFELHASQRMSTFNFFVVLSALLISGLIKTFEKDFSYPQMGYSVSFALMLVSVVFWKLDQRVRFLIKHAEEALSDLEKGSAYPALFKEEAVKTSEKSMGVWKGILFHHLRYSHCFELIYLMFFVAGVIGLFARYFITN
jgi:hypothetical protein